VVTEIKASLFGGSLSQMLKCVTAVKLSRELEKRKIPAVPVCWIGCAPPGDLRALSVTLLDSQGELHRLQLENGGAESSAANPLPEKRIAGLLETVEALGRGGFDAEILGILHSAYSPGRTLAAATAHLISALMKEWGMIVLDPQTPRLEPLMDEKRGVARDRARRTAGPRQSSTGCASEFLEQSMIFPVAANVMGPGELGPFLEVLPAFDELDLPRPVAWPHPGATILDTRSCRTLEKYGLRIQELFSGESELTEKIKRAISRSASRKLDDLAREIRPRMEVLGNLLPAAGDILVTRNSCMEKILYQIGKMRERFEAACARKEEAAERRIRRACNLLAPEGQAQEKGLSGILFLLRHSRSMLRLLYDKLDVLRFEHQLLFVD
jgi:uncharacterized protein YllA (UPF0747 family)